MVSHRALRSRRPGAPRETGARALSCPRRPCPLPRRRAPGSSTAKMRGAARVGGDHETFLPAGEPRSRGYRGGGYHRARGPRRAHRRASGLRSPCKGARVLLHPRRRRGDRRDAKSPARRRGRSVPSLGARAPPPGWHRRARSGRAQPGGPCCPRLVFPRLRGQARRWRSAGARRLGASLRTARRGSRRARAGPHVRATGLRSLPSRHDPAWCSSGAHRSRTPWSSIASMAGRAPHGRRHDSAAG